MVSSGRVREQSGSSFQDVTLKLHALWGCSATTSVLGPISARQASAAAKGSLQTFVVMRSGQQWTTLVFVAGGSRAAT